MGTDGQSASGAGHGWLRRHRYRALLVGAVAVVLVLRLAVMPRLDAGTSANVVATLYVLAAVAAVGLSIRAAVEAARSRQEHPGERTTDG